MTRETARALCQLNTEFYERNAASFSQTRNAPWEGWRRCMAACGFDGSDGTPPDQLANAQTAGQVASAHLPGDHSSSSQAATRSLASSQPLACSVLDIACGNLRFEAFLAGSYPHIDWSFFAVDNCEPLVASGQEDIAKNVHFTCEDIVTNLIEGLPAAEPANIPALAAATPFDLVVSFGFMHHIPSFELRLQFLLEALSQVSSGGYLVISFWQFLNDTAKRPKIEQTHAEALAFFAGCEEAHANDRDAGPETGCSDSGGFALQGINPGALEPNDYFLGWKNEPGNYRYCHHFSDDEIDQIITALAPHATLVESFSADGKPGNLNRYLVFKRN